MTHIELLGTPETSECGLIMRKVIVKRHSLTVVIGNTSPWWEINFECLLLYTTTL